MIKARVNIIGRKQWMYLMPTSGGVVLPPEVRLSKPVGVRELGEATQAAFAKCLPAGSIGIPRDWDIFAASALKAFDLASWNDLVAGAFSVAIDEVDHGFIVCPRRRVPRKHAFVALDDTKNLHLHHSATAEEMGAAILRAFDRCDVGPSPYEF